MEDINQNANEIVSSNTVQAPQDIGVTNRRSVIHGLAGSPLFLIVAIVTTISSLCTIGVAIMSFGLFSGGILGFIATIFALVGVWKVYGMGRRQTQATKGLADLRTSLILNFVHTVIKNVGLFILALLILLGASVIGAAASDSGNTDIGLSTIGIALLLVFALLLPFIIECIYFSSIKRVLSSGINVLGNDAVGVPAGGFAAVMLILKGLVDFIPAIVIMVLQAAVMSLLGNLTDKISFLSKLSIGSIGIFKLVCAVIKALGSIFGAVLIFKYNAGMRKS